MSQSTGITIERAPSGKPIFARIDLRKNSDIIPILQSKGVEVETPVKWTAKIKRSFTQAKNGEWKKGDINNFWGE